MDIRFGKHIQSATAAVLGIAIVSLTACNTITSNTASDLVAGLELQDVYIGKQSDQPANAGLSYMSSNEELGLSPLVRRQDPTRPRVAADPRDTGFVAYDTPTPSVPESPYGEQADQDIQATAQAGSSIAFVAEQPEQLVQPPTLNLPVDEQPVPVASQPDTPETTQVIAAAEPDEAMDEPEDADEPATDELAEVVSRAIYESQATFSTPQDVSHVNVNDGFHFAPIQNAPQTESQAAPVVTSDTPELSAVAKDILANADSPETSLALAESMNGVRAADLMPQVWVQDDEVQIDPIALEPFSVATLPMYQRGVEFDPIATADFQKKSRKQNSTTDQGSWLSPKRPKSNRVAKKTRQSNGVQVSYETMDGSSFVNVQSNGVEYADVVGGVTLGEIVPNPADCNVCPTDGFSDTNCPTSETVVMPASSIRPPDEYVCDGGDAGVHVRVNDDWSVRGLDLEDTVGHFDTLDGRTLVSPSNSVCVYAPRFANVRKVVGAYSDDQIIEPGRLLRPEIVGQDRQQESFLSLDKREMAKRDVQIGNALVFRDRTRGISMNIRQRVRSLTKVQDVYHDFHILQFGILKRSEKARLAEFVDAAEFWTEAVGPEVLIDNVAATIDVTSQSPAIAYHVDDSGNPQLRVVKIASTKEALPGDEVEFTLRFDNVGDQTIGNVTIIDNLTARLEYVPDSAKCDINADFFTEENEGGSLTLRWEVIQPLKAGEGGVATFKCKMR